MSTTDAKEWLDKNYPIDDRPPFGDESLRNDPAYETVDTLEREEAIQIMAEFGQSAYSQGYKDALKAAVQQALFEYSVGTNGLGISEAIRSLPIPEAK